MGHEEIGIAPVQDEYEDEAEVRKRLVQEVVEEPLKEVGIAFVFRLHSHCRSRCYSPIVARCNTSDCRRNCERKEWGKVRAMGDQGRNDDP